MFIHAVRYMVVKIRAIRVLHVHRADCNCVAFRSSAGNWKC
jgi:hypothetical protein